MKLGIIVVTVFGTIVAGCSSSDESKAEAVGIGIDRVGECLSAAGWDTDPEHVEEGTSEAPADDTYRVSFQHLDDGDRFLRLAVNVKTGEVLAYGDEDRTVLAAAGCSL